MGHYYRPVIVHYSHNSRRSRERAKQRAKYLAEKRAAEEAKVKSMNDRFYDNGYECYSMAPYSISRVDTESSDLVSNILAICFLLVLLFCIAVTFINTHSYRR